MEILGPWKVCELILKDFVEQPGGIIQQLKCLVCINYGSWKSPGYFFLKKGIKSVSMCFCLDH